MSRPAAFIKSSLNWTRWLRTARADARRGPVLTTRHIYILPTRAGVLYGTIIIAMLLGSINYSLSLGFVLTFLLAALGIVCMLHTWRNLAWLEVSHCQASPVFADEDAALEVRLKESSGRMRHAIYASCAACLQPQSTDIPPRQSGTITLAYPTARRGWSEPGRLTLFTVFPLGLLQAWSYADTDCRVLVYPRPAASGRSNATSTDQAGKGSRDSLLGDQDFAGLRHYRPGDSPRRIDWKASSREQGMYSKHFQGEPVSSVWLDWHETTGPDGEERICQLVRWVVDAHQAGGRYGLRLPQLTLAADRGEAHYHRCLQALALMELPA